MNRLARHGAFLGLTAGAGIVTTVLGSSATLTERLSLLTAWLCLFFLAAALAVGPLRALRSGRPVLNDLLRRDLGIWAGLTGLAHLVLATEVVMTPAYFAAYIRPSGEGDPGAAGWIGTGSILVGYVIGLLFLLLLALSNNGSLRGLGPDRWKKLQRTAPWVFGLTVAHGLVFQVIEGRTGLWLGALLLVTAGVVVLRRRVRRMVGAKADH